MVHFSGESKVSSDWRNSNFHLSIRFSFPGLFGGQFRTSCGLRRAIMIQSNVNWTFWGKVACWCWELWWQRQVQSKWTPMIIMCRQQSHSQFIFLGKLCGFGGQQIRQSPHLSIRAVIWTSPSDSWIGRRQSCLRRMVQSNIGPSDIFWAKWLPAIPQYLCPRVLSELQFVHFLISYFWQWRMICGWHNIAMWNLWWYYWHPSFISRSPFKRENQSNLCNICVQNKTSLTSPPNFGYFVNWAHEQMEKGVWVDYL